MHETPILSVLALTAALSAQSIYVPDSSPNSGPTQNAFPFNTSDIRYQVLVTAADLGSQPALISGFALAPYSSGEMRYGRVIMKMAHFSGATLSTTFDQNLLGGAVTTMDVTNWSWFVTAHTWQQVDLHTPFAYNGVDGIVVEFTVLGRTAGTMMWRENTNQRVFRNGFTGQTTGSTDMSGFKMRLMTGDAGSGMFGPGCIGTGALLPMHRLLGSSQLGQTTTCQVTLGAPNALAILHLGFWSGGAYPLDLTPFGLPGCRAYVPPSAELVTMTDGAGTANVPVAVPNLSALVGLAVWTQFGVFHQPTNAISLTNYCRALVGT